MVHLVVFINLFFIPLVPLFMAYKIKQKPLEPSLDLLFQYGIVAVCNIPLTKVFIFLVNKANGIFISMDSGYYTVAALFPTILAVLFYYMSQPYRKHSEIEEGKRKNVDNKIYKDSGQAERIDWIDATRCFAIFCVVLNHAIENIYILNVENLSTLSTKSQLFAIGSFTFGRLGVPIFLMITGYLLLDRNWNQESCLKFWKNNCFRLFVCTEIWWIIYNVFIAVYHKTPFNMVYFIQDLLFLKKINLGHVWYMPMILGLYILIPMAGIALQKFDIKHLLFPIVVFSVYSFGYPVLSIISREIGYPTSLQFSLGFSGGEYGLYLIFGYLIKKKAFFKTSNSLAAITFAGAFCFTVFLQICEYRLGHTYNVWYNNGFLAASSIALMILFSKVLASLTLNEKFMCIVKNLAKSSFGIYLIHVPILRVIKPFIVSTIKLYPIQFAYLTLTVFLLSWVLVELCGKVPVIGKVAFNMKP